MKNITKLKEITFIVCSNGFGHYKRCARVVHKLLDDDKKIHVNFICEIEILEKQSNWIITKKLINNPRFNFINGESTIKISMNKKTKKQIFQYNGIEWLDEKLIKESDLVISDNIASVLKIRPDTILMGSFLWSDIILESMGSKLLELADLELKLIKNENTEMIALRDMAMPNIVNYTSPFLTSWIVEESDYVISNSKIKNILVIGGGTGYLDPELISICKQLSLSKKYTIHTSKKISSKLPESILHKVFMFTNYDFNQIDLIIGRPGIGTLTDCVTYCIPIFGIGEYDNKEIQHNLKKIKSLFFGIDISSKINFVNDLIEKIQFDGSYMKFQKKLEKVEKQGLKEITNFILNKLYEQ